MVSALGQSAASPINALQSAQAQNRNSVQSTLQRSIQNPEINTSALIGTQNATNLISTAVSNMQNFINTDRQENFPGAPSRTANALFGGSTNVLSTLRSSSQARIQQSLQQSGQAEQNLGFEDQKQQLVNRLSELNIEQLAVLDNAFKDNPEIDVPTGLAQSIDNMSDRDRTIFKLAVDEAITIVLQQQQDQSEDSGSTSTGSIFDLET